MQSNNIKPSLPEHKKTTNAFLDSLTPCELRAWSKWFPHIKSQDIMMLRILRGGRFCVIQGGKVGKPKQLFSYTPSPTDGGHAA